MTNHQSPARASQFAGSQRALRVLALAAVIVGVLGLAAAAAALSYPGIHAIALVAGVSPALARLYPLIFDAMLVVASAAILSLRGAGAVTRCYAWFSLLLLLCAAAGADALHATGSKIPHRSAAATAAIIPWALVLLGFGLLLAMLRHARLRRAQAAQARASAAPPAELPATRAPAAELPATKVPAAELPAAAAPAAVVQAPSTQEPAADGPAPGLPPAPAPEPPPSWPGASWPGADEPGRSGGQADSQAPELALDAEPGNDDPTSDEAHSASDGPARWVPRARAAAKQETDGRDFSADQAPIMAPAPTAEVMPGRPASAELGHDAADELDHAAGTELSRGGNGEHDLETEPAPGPEGGPDGEPEPRPVSAAPFERMWSSPTPPDV
jgi:hypothetical protein